MTAAALFSTPKPSVGPSALLGAPCDQVKVGEIVDRQSHVGRSEILAKMGAGRRFRDQRDVRDLCRR